MPRHSPHPQFPPSNQVRTALAGFVFLLLGVEGRGPKHHTQSSASLSSTKGSNEDGHAQSPCPRVSTECLFSRTLTTPVPGRLAMKLEQQGSDCKPALPMPQQHREPALVLGPCWLPATPLPRPDPLEKKTRSSWEAALLEPAQTSKHSRPSRYQQGDPGAPPRKLFPAWWMTPEVQRPVQGTPTLTL